MTTTSFRSLRFVRSSPLMSAHAVASTGGSDARLREYERRSALQDEIFRPAYRRAEHRAHIEEQLKRLGVARSLDRSSSAASGDEAPRDLHLVNLATKAGGPEHRAILVGSYRSVSMPSVTPTRSSASRSRSITGFRLRAEARRLPRVSARPRPSMRALTQRPHVQAVAADVGAELAPLRETAVSEATRSLNLAPHIAKPRDYRRAAQRQADVIGGSVPPVRLRAARRFHLGRPSKAHQETKERDGPLSSLDPSTPWGPNDDVAIAPAFAGLGA